MGAQPAMAIAMAVTAREQIGCDRMAHRILTRREVIDAVFVGASVHLAVF
jgi:hypothetical protein